MSQSKLGGHCCTNARVPFHDTVMGCMGADWTCCQVFLGSEFTHNKRRELNSTETKKLIKIVGFTGFKVYTHYPYTMNLVKKCTKAGMTGLQSELDTLAPFGGRIVIHPNSPAVKGGPTNKQTTHKDYVPQYKAAIKTMMCNLGLLKYPAAFSLLLEPPAGEGQKIGWSFDQIAYIVKLLKQKNLPVGLCIDTCHSFAAGLSTFMGRRSVNRFFDKLAEIGALELVKCVHLNDSKGAYESMKDSHAPLCCGLIWQDRPRGFESMVNKCRELGIDIICETDGDEGVKKCLGVPLCGADEDTVL